jgi:MraZ protein
MTQFLGTHRAKLDAKGRTSVPAQFRAAMRKDGDSATAALVLRPSHKHNCVEGWPADAFAEFSKRLERLDIFDDDSEDLTTALYADAWPVEADKEGRIILPDSLVQHAGLSDSVVFMGLGRQFQIWEPEAAARRAVAARERARGLSLPATAA